MSSLLFPYSLPGIEFNYLRQYVPATIVQEAMSGVTSTLQLRAYPLVHFEYSFEFLQDTNSSPAALGFQQLTGFINQVGGRFDTFLHTDPDFNTVSNMQFAITDGVTTSFQTTATYGNSGGPGAAELIQNFNGAPTYFVNRYGFGEQMLSTSKTNSLLQSQAFDNASWTKSNFTVTPNTTQAPDLTTTMDSLVESVSTNVQHIVSQSVTVSSAAANYTLSVFVKPSARSWVLLNMSESLGGTFLNVWFNISTGAIGTTQTGANWSNASATITAVPDDTGVYRISITGTKTNAATSITCGLYSSTGDTISTYTGTTSTVATIAWGAQFEGGSIPSMYIPTTTATVTITDYTLGPTGIITTPAPLTSGWFLKWSGSFYYRCRFDDDKYEFKKTHKGLWTLPKISFTSMTL